MGFSWQEYFSGLPFHSVGNLPDPGIEPRSPTLQADSLLSEPLTVQRIDLIYTTNCGKFLKRWEYQITLLVSWETCMWVKKQHLELYLEQLTRSKLGKECDKAVYCHPAYFICLICRVHHWKCQAGWITNWNQECLEKYHQPQHGKLNHANGRKWRGTKEPLDEDKRGEWKSWLKTQHLKN